MDWTNWTWDPNKNRENIQKHGFSFETAVLVFDDPDLVIEEDFYPYEQRWRAIGEVEPNILLVIHTLPYAEGEPGRIISARRATPYERRRYEEEHGQAY